MILVITKKNNLNFNLNLGDGFYGVEENREEFEEIVKELQPNITVKIEVISIDKLF
jgi:hypothetical protein